MTADDLLTLVDFEMSLHGQCVVTWDALEVVGLDGPTFVSWCEERGYPWCCESPLERYVVGG